jgi:histone acetyltransferase (RNA polymerase elongator complex component)
MSTATGNNKWTESLPDEDKYYKIQLRVKNLKNISRPVAQITSIVKSGTTTATVTTDVPH